MTSTFAIDYTTPAISSATVTWERFRITSQTNCKGKPSTTVTDCTVAHVTAHTWHVVMASQSFANRQYTVTVTRLPGYEATAVCECSGYVTHGHCKHQAIAIQAAQNAADCAFSDARQKREMYA